MHTEVQTKDKAPTGNRVGPNYSSVIFFYSRQELHLCQSQWCPSERTDRSMCHTTLNYKPMKTKIQCYSVLMYSTCNQKKTSSCSSSYYALVYLSMCVLVIFSGQVLTVVFQKIIVTNTFYDII